MKEERLNSIEDLKKVFSEIEDFRNPQGKQYILAELLALSILSMLSGAEDFTGMSEFCKAKRGFLEQYFHFPKGKTPSHDLFRWIFSVISPDEFLGCFTNWLKGLNLSDKVVAIDGKAIRATRPESGKNQAIQMVSAWASEQRLALGQVRVDDKSNEKTAIPKLLRRLHIKDCVVTIDAMGCHPNIAQNILDKEADYVLALKKNNKNLFVEVENHFSDLCQTDVIDDFAETKEFAHGREEHRKCYLVKRTKLFSGAEKWPKLKSIACVENKRTLATKTSIERRYFLSSSERSAEKILEATRQHWGIENSLHWRLDVTFNEDKSRTKFKNCPENLAICRKIVLSILDCDPSRLGGRNKKLKLAWDDQFLIKILNMYTKKL